MANRKSRKLAISAVLVAQAMLLILRAGRVRRAESSIDKLRVCAKRKRRRVSRRYGLFFDGWLSSYIRARRGGAQVQVILLFMTITHEGEHQRANRGDRPAKGPDHRGEGRQTTASHASQGRHKRSKGRLGVLIHSVGSEAREGEIPFLLARHSTSRSTETFFVDQFSLPLAMTSMSSWVSLGNHCRRAIHEMSQSRISPKILKALGARRLSRDLDRHQSSPIPVVREFDFFILCTRRVHDTLFEANQKGILG